MSGGGDVGIRVAEQVDQARDSGHGVGQSGRGAQDFGGGQRHPNIAIVQPPHQVAEGNDPLVLEGTQDLDGRRPDRGLVVADRRDQVRDGGGTQVDQGLSCGLGGIGGPGGLRRPAGGGSGPRPWRRDR